MPAAQLNESSHLNTHEKQDNLDTKKDHTHEKQDDLDTKKDHPDDPESEEKKEVAAAVIIAFFQRIIKELIQEYYQIELAYKKLRE